jgi:flagellar protein FliL
MVAEPAKTYEVATRPGRNARPLLLICMVLGSIAVGGAAGALGLLAPVYDLLSAREVAATPPPPTFYALPEFRIAVDPLAEDRTLPAQSFGRHLRTVVQLEVEPSQMPHVDALQPRIVDVLLTFLHALDQRDVGSVRNLDRLKAQMLHRVREVTGDDAVRGILITELVLM